VVSDKEKEIESLYASIGIEALRFYKRNDIKDPNITAVFSNVIKLENEIIESEKELEQIQRNEKDSVVNTVISFGKTAYLKTAILFKKKNLPQYFRQVGKAVCESEIFQSSDDLDMKDVYLPYIKKKEELKHIELKREDKKVNQEKLEKRILDITKNRWEAWISNIDKKIEEKESLFFIKTSALGKEFNKKPNPELLKDEEINKEVGEITKLKKKHDKLKKQLEKLNAAIRINGIIADINSKESIIEEIEEKKKKLEEQISSIRTEVVDFQNEIEKLEKLRGPIEKLIKKKRNNLD
jgi:chromosome segregation ATPase